MALDGFGRRPLFLPDKRKKPARWAFTRGLVAPEWAWFWRDVNHALIFQERAGSKVYDFGGRVSFDIKNSAPWARTRLGAGVEFQEGGAGTQQVVQYDSPIYTNRAKLTVFFVASDTSSSVANAARRVISARTASNIDFAIWWDNTLNRFTLNIDDKNTPLTPTGGFTFENNDNKPHTVSITWDNTINNVRLMINGVLHSSTSLIGSPTGGKGATQLGWGNLPTNTSADRNFGGTIVAGYLIDRYVPDDEIRLLHADPFGPFRMRDEAGVAFAVAVGNTADTDAGLFMSGQYQPIIEPWNAIPY